MFAAFALATKETRIHQVPVNKSHNHSESQHQQHRYFLGCCCRFSGARGEQQQIKAARTDNWTKGRQFHRVRAFSPKLSPIEVNQSGRQENQKHREESRFEMCHLDENVGPSPLTFRLFKNPVVHYLQHGRVK